MKYTLSILSLLFLSLCISGCPGSNPSDNSGNNDELFPSEKNPFSLYGTVVDSNNVPIADAEVHYLFGNSLVFPKTMHFQKTNPTVFISFGIAKQGQTTLRVYRFGTRKLVATLVDTILPAGQYSIFFDTKDLTNGMYVYQLHAESLFVQKKLALMNPDLSQLSQTQPLAKTEGTGKFQIPFSVLGIGEEIFYTNGIGETLGSFTLDSISVVIFQKEKPAVLVEGFSIDPNQNLIRTFTIK